MQKGYQFPIIIDSGSSTCRIGLAGQDQPRHSIPSVIGKPKYQNMMFGQQKQNYIGEQAISKRGVLKLNYPIQRGQINDMQKMQKIWQHSIINELRQQTEQHPVLLMTGMYNNEIYKNTKQSILQIFFEKFQTPRFYQTNRTKLSLYSSGRSTGLAIHSGDHTTQYVGVVDGKILKNGVLNTCVAGCDVTQYFGRLLSNDLGWNFQSSAQKQILKNIKQKLCYTVIDYQHEKKIYQIDFGISAAPSDCKQKVYQYKLPDQNIIKINQQCFQAPEIMFNPKLKGQDAYGMHQNVLLMMKRIQKPQLIRWMYENVVLSGGNTLFKGMEERLRNELNKQCPPECVINIDAPQERLNTSWIGGSILASLSTFNKQWITKANYQQMGSSKLIDKILSEQCF